MRSRAVLMRSGSSNMLSGVKRCRVARPSCVVAEKDAEWLTSHAEWRKKMLSGSPHMQSGRTRCLVARPSCLVAKKDAESLTPHAEWQKKMRSHSRHVLSAFKRLKCKL